MDFPIYHTINYLYCYFLGELDNLLGTTFSKPTFIFLSITRRCNSSCKICLLKFFKKSKKKEEMSTEQIKKLITDLRKWLGPYILCIAGGEPTLRKDLWEIIKFANNQKIRTVLSTNGTLITKKDIPKIINSGLKDIRISLDSLNPKTYKKIRGINAQKKVLQTIDLLKKHTKNISVSISMVITKHNVDEIPKLIEFVKQKKLNSITLSPITLTQTILLKSTNVKNKFHNLWPDPKQTETIIDQTIKYKKKGYPIANPIRHLELIKQYYKNPNSIDEKCRASQCLFIASTGYVGICQKKLESVIYKSPKEIWNSKGIKQLRKKLSKCKKSCAISLCFSYTHTSLINRIKQFNRINTFR